MPPLNEWLPLASLTVAALALFFGPLLQWRMARRQVEATLKAANKQIIAPMRQQWIETLRLLVAEVTTEAHYYFIAAGPEDEEESAEKNDQARQRMMLSEQKILLLLNLNESDHQALADQIRAMVGCATSERPGTEFADLHQGVTALARRVFKREWDRVKEDL